VDDSAALVQASSIGLLSGLLAPPPALEDVSKRLADAPPHHPVRSSDLRESQISDLIRSDQIIRHGRSSTTDASSSLLLSRSPSRLPLVHSLPYQSNSEAAAVPLRSKPRQDAARRK
jgi:hypothetical protein